jgi:aryl-alcohol dehydrogenase-like predicted oxidoreductase
VLGVGTWQLGDGERLGGRDPRRSEISLGTIRHGIEAGANWIDTAPVYGLGHAEKLVAKAVRGLAEPPLIFTKCGYVWDNRGRVRQTLARESVRAELEASLRRLGVDAVDLYQVHWPVPEDELEEGWAALVELCDEGKARHIGVSNLDHSQLERLEAIASVETLQPPYSLLAREVEAETLPYCQRRGLGVIVYSPMAAGLLSGRMTRERIEAFGEEESRRNFPLFREPELTRSLARAEALQMLAVELGVSCGVLAVSWTLANPAVHGAIVGYRYSWDVDDLAAAANDDGALAAAVAERLKLVSE